jgi:protein-S-isoprenylcysteine O-methyltransferase Ste14
MTTADGALIGIWCAVVTDLLRARRSASTARVIAGRSMTGATGRAAILIATAGAMALLEHLQPGPAATPVRSALGLGLASGGFVLHAIARTTLGRWWSTDVVIRDGQPLTTGGPYAMIRHPLYAAVLLIASGTLIAHPSLAMLCATTGIAIGTSIKIRSEDALLRQVFGAAFDRYAADVPALVPRLRRGRRG